MVNDAVVSHNSVNELYYLEEVDSTNTWAKANLDKFGPVGAVYTTSQTAGRGRRGHTWINASGQALYYTVVLKTELAQPESLPLFASMAVADALEQRYGIQCQIKWPNDLLLNGKKIVGILCEGCRTTMPLCVALASIWPSRRAILTQWSCPTEPAWRCRALPWIRWRTPPPWRRA